MKLRKLIGLAGMFLLASGVSAGAQPIAVSINGGTATLYSDLEPISITIPGTITNTVTVHIYDTASLFGNGDTPTHNIPAVTINGTVGSGSPLVEVLVADGDSYLFPQFPTDPVSASCLDFGGLSFGSTALRDVSRIAVSVGGDITGDISAGAIRRIQALGRFEEAGNPPELEYVGGKITGNITATTYNRSFVGGGGGYNAIGVIWAGDEISGSISCTNDDDFNPGGLTWLIVGREGNTAIDGLLGDVRIDFGAIDKIHTAGPIGSATLTPKIWGSVARL